MKRNLEAIKEQQFDLLIIGGGINGLACARDAALRGLKVILIEKKDFGGQTSANSAKVAHCGMRYLQHLDFKRMKESIRERNLFNQLAPHLMESQPFIMPIYGHGIKGKETFTLYMKVYDLLSYKRKQFKDSYHNIPDSKIISPKEVLKIIPNVTTEGLTGGVVWHEGQIQNTERLSLAILSSAAEHGAQFFNYMTATKIENEGKKITGVEVNDILTGKTTTIKTHYVLNVAGPWTNNILKLTTLPIKDHGIHMSKAFNLITKSISDKYAITFSIQQMYTDKKAIVNKQSSLQFAIPWREKTIFATLHSACDENIEDVHISEEEITQYLSHINEGLPGITLKTSDIEHILWGIIPAEGKNSAAPLKQYKIIDHLSEDGITGLGTLVGVKYTTARDVAEKTIDMVEKRLNKIGNASLSRTLPYWGGDIEFHNAFIDDALNKYSHAFSKEIIINLIKTYGSKFTDILNIANKKPEHAKTIADTAVLSAQIIYAINEELAETLPDVILRRTDLGSLKCPKDNVIIQCADIMGNEKNWSDEKKLQEIDLVKQAYLTLPPHP